MNSHINEFCAFNQMSKSEILEDIDHRVRCGLTNLSACREIVQELSEVGQILSIDSIRSAYRRWKSRME